MDKEHSGQLELFAQENAQRQARPRISGAFISYISRYEKTILIIIGFAVTGIIAFSLGVEKGKKYIMLKTGSQLDIAVATPKVPEPAAVPAPEQQRDEVKEYIQSYTIQVASFLNKKSAQQEAESLKKKGLSPLVLSKGKFSIVCVGSFPDRKDAESLLPRLRKQYQDCLIRRL